jgi:oxygen-independent coproporphyrinogen-3 oxidase
LKRFSTDINSVYGDIILKHNKSGLLSVSGDRIYLTEYGTDVSNYVLSDYILD